jgi:hypothetical protein
MSSASAGDSEPGAAAEDRGCLLGWRRREVVEVSAEGVVDLAGDVAFEAAHDLTLAFAFTHAALGVGVGALAVAQTADRDEVQRSVGLAVAAGVEAVANGFARGRGDWAGATDGSERRFAVEALDVLAGCDEHLSGVAGGDPEQLHGAWGSGRDKSLEVVVERRDFSVERFDPLRD